MKKISKLPLFEVVLLLVLFLLAGTLGRQPWRGDETYSFGMIYHYLTTNTWLIPVNAGISFLEKPPLYLWTAKLFALALGDVLTLHEAARLATTLCFGVTLFFLWRTTQLLWGEPDQCWRVFWLFVGTVGLLRYAHEMSSDISLMAGSMVAIYGMALWMVGSPVSRAGFWLGLGVGMAFLSKGFVVPVILGGAGVLLFVTHAALRSKATLHMLLVALLVASPFLVIWPWLLYLESPSLFMQWFWDNNVGRFLGFSVEQLGAKNRPFYYLQNTPWFAFPIFPLALWAIWRKRKALFEHPSCALPFSVALVGMVLLQVSASGRVHYLLPVMPAFALLALCAFADVPAWLKAGWAWFARVVFSAALLLFWLVWWSLIHPQDARPLAELSGLFAVWLPPTLVLDAFPWVSVLTASTLTVLWAASFRLPARDYATRIWATGSMAVWGVLFTLLLPWLDMANGYRDFFARMQAFVQNSPYAGACIAMFEVDEQTAPMFHYANGSLPPMQLFNGDTCPLILTQGRQGVEAPQHEGWKVVWEESTLQYKKKEVLRLYGRE